MSRMIDADALYEKTAEWEARALSVIEKLNRKPFEEMDSNEITEWRKWSCILNERSAFKHDVADAPTVEPQQWIPVSSGKLPENYANVLLQIAEECRYDDIGEVIDYWFVSGCRFNKKWFANEHPDVSKQIDGVVAWMPLPEPWEGGETK